MKKTLEEIIKKWAKEENTTVTHRRNEYNTKDVIVQTPPMGYLSLSRLYKMCNPTLMTIFAGKEYLHGLEITISE